MRPLEKKMFLYSKGNTQQNTQPTGENLYQPDFRGGVDTQSLQRTTD